MPCLFVMATIEITCVQIYSQTSPYSAPSLSSTCAVFRWFTIFIKWRESMDDHFLPLQHDLLGHVGVHSIHPLAGPEMHNLQGPYVPDLLWWQYLAYAYDYVQLEHMIWAWAVTDCYLPITQEIPFVISDCISWSQNANGLMARSPILSGQIPEKPRPLAYSLCNGNGNINNQAGAIPNCCTHAGYNQVGNSWSHCTPNSPDVDTQSTSQYQKTRNSLVVCNGLAPYVWLGPLRFLKLTKYQHKTQRHQYYGERCTHYQGQVAHSSDGEDDQRKEGNCVCSYILARCQNN